MEPLRGETLCSQWRGSTAWKLSPSAGRRLTWRCFTTAIFWELTVHCREEGQSRSLQCLEVPQKAEQSSMKSQPVNPLCPWSSLSM